MRSTGLVLRSLLIADVSGILVERSFDTEAIAHVLLDPRIVQETEPGTGMKATREGLDSAVWNERNYFFGFRMPEESAYRGVFPFLMANDACVEIHGYVLPEHRKSAANLEIARKCLEWIFDTSEIIKVQAILADCHRGPIRFSKNLGLKPEGRSINSFRIGDKVFDRWILGMTKTEMRRTPWAG